MPADPVNIFVVGLDDFNHAQLKKLPGASHYHFHALFDYHELKQQDSFPVEKILNEGITRLREFSGHVDAIVGYWDFPVSTLLPLLREAVNLPTTSIESVLKCEHKYWSRLVQREVVREYIPEFDAIDPFAEDPMAGTSIAYPFWIKPVKSVLSYLGYRISNHADLEHALTKIRAGIARYAIPFNMILEKAALPESVVAVDGYHCIIESIISKGRQCTMEGYSWNDEVHIYGVIDSLRDGPGGSSFSRYQYPSTLPKVVIERMTKICQRFIHHIDYKNAPFNIEFFWDEDSNDIWLLEINTRISKSHAPLFHMVDGCYHHKVMLDLGLQRKPDFPFRQGQYAYAAKFMLRHYQDACVTRVPSAEELQQLKLQYPDIAIQVNVEKGMQLSTLRDQDSYSYEVAVLFIGGKSPEDLETKYQLVINHLPLEFSQLKE